MEYTLTIRRSTRDDTAGQDAWRIYQKSENSSERMWPEIFTSALSAEHYAQTTASTWRRHFTVTVDARAHVS